MTSTEIRQSFLDFFREKQHTIVPSSSLLPDSPNLLFTNAGMNQFVPIFLGQTGCPYTPGRAADTQKCIRAGGKHNDLDDVGLDTYHHTFFEMLGNWSFGDYFKKEAIEWAWELIVERWGFPSNRLYATVYRPDKSAGDPSEFDQEAHGHWAALFEKAGLDPALHIVNGNKKDNFWMMGDTGPCGPCSELHVSLLPELDEAWGRDLVNAGDPDCIEIWNLVFIQFNANPDGTFTPLPAKHVDTGMGFERVTSIIQCTQGFTDFSKTISNYETDIFAPLFAKLEELSDLKYHGTITSPAYLPTKDRDEHGKVDIAFRVIADHIRTLSFAIADGIQPGNTDRHYVLRRILRRAVRYGRTLGFHEPFFYKLVAVLARTMGDVFPEVRAKQKHIEEVIKREEEMFNKGLVKGIPLFEDMADFHAAVSAAAGKIVANAKDEMMDGFGRDAALEMILGSPALKEALAEIGRETAEKIAPQDAWTLLQLAEKQRKKSAEIIGAPLGTVVSLNQADTATLIAAAKRLTESTLQVSGGTAFILYDTYGFPLDLTELMARERGLTVDVAGFEKLMDEQRARARAAQKREIILVSDVSADTMTEFVGYEMLECEGNIISLTGKDDFNILIVDRSPLYAEMGGQVGDTGWIELQEGQLPVLNTAKAGNAFTLKTPRYFPFTNDSPKEFLGFEFKEPIPVRLKVDAARRAAIQRHHTVTHLLHWALHETVSREATQKGSFVGPEKLTFDFNSSALTPAQVREVERLVNERIVENAGVTWNEVAYAEVRGRAEVMQFFGDKYGETVRLVEVGNYSKELCGGTHTRATGEIGLFRIVSEAAIASGVRRIEAVAGLNAYEMASADGERLKAFATKLNAPVGELEKKLDALLAQQKDLEKALKAAQQRDAAGRAKDLLARAETINGLPAIIANLGTADGDTLQTVADALKAHGFKGVLVLSGASHGAVALVASVSPDFTAKIQAGKIIQQIAPMVGGKGGGKPDNARGGGKDASQLDAALAHARTLF